MEKQNLEELAIFGGKPIREKGWPSWPMIGEEEIDAAIGVLKKGKLSEFGARRGKPFLGGEKIKELEKQFSDYFGTKYAIAVDNATAGLNCCVAACGAGPGDEVITSPYTFTATASAILRANAIPIFADIDEKTFCVKPSEIEKKIRPWTKAIIPVHIFGHPAEMDDIMGIAKKYNLKVIEDCAQSPGAKYKGRLTGAIGDMSVFSFNESKDINSGEGGVILTNDDDLAEKARMIRNHGEIVIEGKTRDHIVNIVGNNYRMTELTAAVAIEQFKKLDKFNSKKKQLVDYLTNGLSGIEGITLPYVSPDVEHVFHVYAITYDEKKMGVGKKTFSKALGAEGIVISDTFYIHPLYMNPLYQFKTAYGSKGCPFTCSFYKGEANYEKGSCKTAEEFCGSKGLWIENIRPNCSIEDIQDIIEGFGKVTRNADKLKKLEEK
jgi:dTDP-4-amino-4,6-dideoxygalactose transaminase